VDVCYLRLSAILIMKTIANLLTSIILAAWIAAIAILSIQNIRLISLKFLVFQTIEMPLGIILAFSVGIGAIAGAIAPILWQLANGKRERYYEEEEDF
jgi:lipopolysaccharide assembly protein A